MKIEAFKKLSWYISEYQGTVLMNGFLGEFISEGSLDDAVLYSQSTNCRRILMILRCYFWDSLTSSKPIHGFGSWGGENLQFIISLHLVYYMPLPSSVKLWYWDWRFRKLCKKLDMELDEGEELPPFNDMPLDDELEQWYEQYQSKQRTIPSDCL